MVNRVFSADSSTKDRRAWHGSAFSLEALLLLLFLMMSAVVLVQIFSTAYLRGQEAAALTPGIILASNEAEAFSSDPASAAATTEFFALQDNELVPVSETEEYTYALTRTVTSEQEPNGTLYRAVIEVTYKDSVIYDLTTARYVSAKGVSRNVN